MKNMQLPNISIFFNPAYTKSIKNQNVQLLYLPSA